METPRDKDISHVLTVEIRLRDNETAYDRYKINPRILIDVGNITTDTTILGSKVRATRASIAALTLTPNEQPRSPSPLASVHPRRTSWPTQMARWPHLAPLQNMGYAWVYPRIRPTPWRT